MKTKLFVGIALMIFLVSVLVIYGAGFTQDYMIKNPAGEQLLLATNKDNSSTQIGTTENISASSNSGSGTVTATENTTTTITPAPPSTPVTPTPTPPPRRRYRPIVTTAS